MTPDDDRDDHPEPRRWRCRGWASYDGPCMDPRCDACCPQADEPDHDDEREEE